MENSAQQPEAPFWSRSLSPELVSGKGLDWWREDQVLQLQERPCEQKRGPGNHSCRLPTCPWLHRALPVAEGLLLWAISAAPSAFANINTV